MLSSYLLGLEILVWSVLIGVDLKRLMIPDKLLLVLTLLRFLESFPQDTHLWAVLTLTATFAGVKIGFEKLTKRLALGWGDVKLAGVCGLWMHLSEVPLFLCLTGLSGSLIGSVFLAIRRQRYFPLAPALVLVLGAMRILKGV